MLTTFCPLTRIATSRGSCCLCDEFRISLHDILLVQCALFSYLPAERVIVRFDLRVFAFASYKRNGPNRMLDHFPRWSGRIQIGKHRAVGSGVWNIDGLLVACFFPTRWRHQVTHSLIRKPRVEHRKWQALVFATLPTAAICITYGSVVSGEGLVISCC